MALPPTPALQTVIHSVLHREREVARIPYLQQRGNRWYFYRRVPGDVKSQIDAEFWRISLDTDSESEARIGVAAHTHRTNEMIAAARDGCLRLLSDHQIDDHALGWSQQFELAAERLVVAEMFPHVDLGEAVSPNERIGNEPLRAILRNRGDLESDVRRWAEREQIKIVIGSPDWEKLLDECHLTWAYTYPEISQNPAVESLRIPGVPLGELVTVDHIMASAKGMPAPLKRPTLTQALEQYVAEKAVTSKNQRQIRPRTVQEWTTAINRFCSLNGDLELEKIERSHVRDFRDILRKTPSRPPNDVKKLTLRDQAKWADETDHSRLAEASIAKQLTALSVVLDFAYRETDLITNRTGWENPCKGLVGHGGNSGGNRRAPFSAEQISKIFDPNNYTPRSISDFWIPIILMFTGARLNEIAQLLADDVKIGDGVCYIDIGILNQTIITNKFSDGPEVKTVKSNQSARLIPLHNDLLEIGFREYLESVTKSDSIFLFPGIEHEKGVARARNMSRRFLTRIRKLPDMDAPGLVLHSLRHNFKMACIEAGAQDHLVRMVMGHTNGNDAANNHYASHLKRNPALAKKEVLDKIRFPVLDKAGLRATAERLMK